MTLLEWARGPALELSMVVFAVGVMWRLVGIALLRWVRIRSTAREAFPKAAIGGVATGGTRSWPHKEFIGRTGWGEALGYSYHIGMFIVILLFAPHIAFFKGLIGISWPALPSNIIHIISIITIALLLAVLVRRIFHPVLRKLSNFDDYFTWFVTALVMVTGVLATANFGAPYERLLAYHILSVCLLLVWFPFGKLMHAFFIMPNRMTNGYMLNRKGAPS